MDLQSTLSRLSMPLKSVYAEKKKCTAGFPVLLYPFVDGCMTGIHIPLLHFTRYLLGRPLVYFSMLQAVEFDPGADGGVFGYAFLWLHSHLMSIEGISSTLIAVTLQSPCKLLTDERLTLLR